MNNKIMSAVRVLLLGVITAALGLGTGLAPQRQDPSGSWIKTRQRLILLSANDGQAHLKLDAEGKINKKNFTAHNTSLDRKVALKFLPDIFSGDPERLARFERDARLLGSINPPNAAIMRRIRPLSAVVERCIR